MIAAVSSTELTTTFEQRVTSLIIGSGAATVCDIGGGRLPMLSPEQAERLNVTYTVLDISREELDLAPVIFDKVCADVAASNFTPDRRVDLAFSHMVAEHVRNGETFHRNVYNMLNPGGLAVHIFPTLYSLPFIVNRIVPDRAASVILNIVAPRDRSLHEKFPARYSWTRGPTKRQLNRLRGVGFEIIEYSAGFGHTYYDRLPIIRTLGRATSQMARRRGWYAFSSYAVVVLRRPAQD